LDGSALDTFTAKRFLGRVQATADRCAVFVGKESCCGKVLAPKQFIVPVRRKQIELTLEVLMKIFLPALTMSLVAVSLLGVETAGPTIAQGKARLLRHPSYSNGKIAFSYLGDIWMANENGSEVRRLTDHTARVPSGEKRG
jgi:hypothetical protein